MVKLITFKTIIKYKCIITEYRFGELPVLAFCIIVHNNIGYMMYKLVNGLLPDILSESYGPSIMKFMIILRDNLISIYPKNSL